MREAQALNKMSHVNVVTVYSLGLVYGSLPYMAMEHIQGQSLRAILQNGRLPVQRAIKIIRDAARGLAHVHAIGIVHRDLKPENILITDAPDPDTVKLVDFGLAKVGLEKEDAPQSAQAPNATDEKQRLTHTGELIGTTAYMSPEQCRGDKADYRSDIYSLTACFYEIITGKPVYEADNPVGLIYKHLNSPIPAVKPQEVDSFDISLNEFISKGLAKDPSARFKSMDELASELDALLPSLQNSQDDKIKPKVLAALVFVCCVLIALAATIITKPIKNESVGNKSPTIMSDEEFKNLLPRAQVRQAMELLRDRQLPDAYSKTDICLKSARLGHEDFVVLLFARAKESFDEDAIYYYCKVKDAYERYPQDCPRDRVLRGMLDLATNLYYSGLPKSAADILNFLNSDLQKNGMPDAYRGNYQFGIPGKIGLDLWNARMLENAGQLEAARARAREVLKENQGPWGSMLASALDLGLNEEAESLIARCEDALSQASMCASSLERGKIELAERAADRMKDLNSRSTEPEYALVRASILIEKGDRQGAKKLLLDYVKNELSPSKSREWRILYQDFAQHLMTLGCYEQAKTLLEKVEQAMPPASRTTMPAELLAQMQNGSQLARYATMRILNTVKTLSTEERFVLTLELYHHYLPKGSSPMRHLAELHCLLNTEDGKNLNKRLRLAALSQYQQALLYGRLPQESLRICDELLAEAQTAETEERRIYITKAVQCKKIQIMHQNGDKDKALLLLKALEKGFNSAPLPWAEFVECELLFARVNESKKSIDLCSELQELRRVARAYMAHSQLRLAHKALDKTGSLNLSESQKRILAADASIFMLERGLRSEAMGMLDTQQNNALNVLRHDRLGLADEYLKATSIAGMQKQADEFWKRKYFF